MPFFLRARSLAERVMFLDGWRAAAIVWMKRAAALCLLVSLFLPVSQCTYEPDPEGGIRETRVIVSYPYTAYSWPGMQRVATYAAFLWPTVLMIAGAVSPVARDRSAVAALEVLLCVGSAWMLFLLTALGELRYGAYVAIGSLAVYFSATLAELLNGLRRRFTKHSP